MDGKKVALEFRLQGFTTYEKLLYALDATVL